MPIIHGATLLDFIREEGYDMPVIAVSHIDEESAIQALLNRGAQGIVEKPFSASRLIEEIERVLDKAEPESPPTATAEPASTDAPPAESSASETEEKPLEPPPADGSIEPPPRRQTTANQNDQAQENRPDHHPPDLSDLRGIYRRYVPHRRSARLCRSDASVLVERSFKWH